MAEVTVLMTNRDPFWMGFTLGAGAITGIAAVMLVGSLITNTLQLGVDDCDRSAWDRCGAAIVTDAKTGLQYLRTTGGGITPRLTIDGEQMQAGAGEG